jgi:microsomal epoxide hydrolase
MRAFVAGLFENAQDPALVEQITKASLHTPEAAARQLLAYPEPRTYWRDAVYSTRKPVLYVVRPRWAAQGENLVRKHPAAELSVFEHAGHALFLDQPDRFNTVVADFLKRRVWP